MVKSPKFFIPEDHYTDLCSWYFKRDMPAPRKEILPVTGVVVENVAAAFLIATEGPICFIEGVIANKDISSRIRNEATKACIRRIMEIAKARGYEQIVGMTKVDCIVSDYAKHFNFKVMGQYTMVAKQL